MAAHQYLMDEHPHFFYPTLACKIGLNEAIVLQQIHSWIQIYQRDPKQYRDRHWHDEAWWIWNSYPEWHEALPYFSVSTIARTLKRLRELGIVKTANYNHLKIDRTLWYTIDYKSYDSLWQDQATNMAGPSCQNGRMEATNMAGPLPSFSSSDLSSDFSSEKELPPADFPTDSDGLWSGEEAPPSVTEDSGQKRLSSLRDRLGSDPLSVAANVSKAREEVEHPDFADPEHDIDPWADGPLRAFCALVYRTDLKSSEQRNWPLALKKWALEWGAVPEDVIDCIKAIPESEFAWMTFKTPYSTSFQEVMDAMIDRIRNDQPINAKGASTSRKEEPTGINALMELMQEEYGEEVPFGLSL